MDGRMDGWREGRKIGDFEVREGLRVEEAWTFVHGEEQLTGSIKVQYQTKKRDGRGKRVYGVVELDVSLTGQVREDADKGC
eukprot:9846-Hanusia_phi.AAC.1